MGIPTELSSRCPTRPPEVESRMGFAPKAIEATNTGAHLTRRSSGVSKNFGKILGISAESAGRHGRLEKICRKMEVEFRAGNFESGVIIGIDAVSHELATHFPAHGPHRNELPDNPLVD